MSKAKLNLAGREKTPMTFEDAMKSYEKITGKKPTKEGRAKAKAKWDKGKK